MWCPAAAAQDGKANKPRTNARPRAGPSKPDGKGPSREHGSTIEVSGTWRQATVIAYDKETLRLEVSGYPCPCTLPCVLALSWAIPVFFGLASNTCPIIFVRLGPALHEKSANRQGKHCKFVSFCHEAAGMQKADLGCCCPPGAVRRSRGCAGDRRAAAAPQLCALWGGGAFSHQQATPAASWRSSEQVRS